MNFSFADAILHIKLILEQLRHLNYLSLQHLSYLKAIFLTNITVHKTVFLIDKITIQI